MVRISLAVCYPFIGILCCSPHAWAGVVYDFYQQGVLQAELTGPALLTPGLVVEDGSGLLLPPDPSPYNVKIFGGYSATIQSLTFPIAVSAGTQLVNFRKLFEIDLAFVGGHLPTTAGTYALDDSLGPPIDPSFQHGLALSHLLIGSTAMPDLPVVPGGPYEPLDMAVVTITSDASLGSVPVPEPSSFLFACFSLGAGVIIKGRAAQRGRARDSRN